MKDMKLYVDSIRAVDVSKCKKLSEESLGKTIEDRVVCGYAIMMIFAMDDFTDSERVKLAMKWLDKFAETVSKESGALSMIGKAKKAFSTMNSFNCVAAGTTCRDCVFCVSKNGVTCEDGYIHRCMCDILKINLNKMESKDDDE